MSDFVRAEGLTKEFPVRRGIVHAVSDVDFVIERGETLCVVGESGCGKSTLGRLLLRLIEPTRGRVLLDGQDLHAMKPAQLREARQSMQMIFQDPYASLDARMSVGQIVMEPLATYGIGRSRAERAEMAKALLEKVGIAPEMFSRYPHQFSGGQRQRIGVARALALNPALIVLDEPVSALDVSIQAQILNLLHDLQEEMRLTYLFISHDLSVVYYIGTRVMVMFLGKLCEIGATGELYAHPAHPYTKFLLSSVPKPDPTGRDRDREILMGEVGSPLNPPSGCRFRTRCNRAQPICAECAPEMRDLGGGHMVACHFPNEA